MKIPKWFFPVTRLSRDLDGEGFQVRRTHRLFFPGMHSEWEVRKVYKGKEYIAGYLHRTDPFADLNYTHAEFYSPKFGKIASKYATDKTRYTYYF